jgi:NitT/TauT family transport system substrate-binding protein
LAWLDSYGVPTKSVQFVELPMSEVGIALERGRIQASFLNEPFTSRLVATGQIRLFGDMYIAVAPELSVAIWFTTRAWVKNNPDTVKKLIKGIYATAKYCNAHYTETGATLIKVANNTRSSQWRKRSDSRAWRAAASGGSRSRGPGRR